MMYSWRDCTSIIFLAVCGVALAGALGDEIDGRGRINEVEFVDSLGNDLSNDGCVEEHCSYTTSKAELLECASVHCKPVKKWIDTTHYSDSRRSVLDSLERCIRMVCHGKGGKSLKECAFACSAKKKRDYQPMMRMDKKWLDPLNYGMTDDKRSQNEVQTKCRNGKCTPDVTTVSHLCEQLCLRETRVSLRPYLCRLKCQQALSATLATSEY